MNLLLSELNRFRSRRAVVLLLALGFLLSLLIAGTTIWQNRPFDEDELAQARAQAMEQATSTFKACEKHPRRYVGATRRSANSSSTKRSNTRVLHRHGALPAGVRLPGAGSAADVDGHPRLSRAAGRHHVRRRDIAAGAMSNTLLFRPNRWQVWAAKLAATVMWTTLVAAVTLAICLVALAATATSDPELGMAGG
jgi:hypothetical protein